jgi:DNA-binding CsgD family transcriptional regulator
LVALQGFEQHYSEFCVPVTDLILKPQVKTQAEIHRFNTRVKEGDIKPPRERLGDPKQIAELRKSGKSFMTIARELSLSDGIVQRRFKEAGVPDPVARRIPLNATDIVRVRRGEELCRQRAPFWSLPNYNLRPNQRGRPVVARFCANRAQLDPNQIVMMRENGMSFNKIAHTLKATVNRVWTIYYNTTGKTPRTPGDVRGNPSEVLRLRKMGMTFDQIGAELSISKSYANILFSQVTHSVRRDSGFVQTRFS